MHSDEIAVVLAFMGAINAGDVKSLVSLMTSDHTFVDSMGITTSGKENMANGWRGFFKIFPDYKNTIEGLCQCGSTVMAYGHASGTYNGKRGLVPENRISMPAAWKAVIDGSKVKEWRVYADWTEGQRIMARDKDG